MGVYSLTWHRAESPRRLPYTRRTQSLVEWRRQYPTFNSCRFVVEVPCSARPRETANPAVLFVVMGRNKAKVPGKAQGSSFSHYRRYRCVAIDDATLVDHPLAFGAVIATLRPWTNCVTFASALRRDSRSASIGQRRARPDVEAGVRHPEMPRARSCGADPPKPSVVRACPGRGREAVHEKRNFKTRVL